MIIHYELETQGRNGEPKTVILEFRNFTSRQMKDIVLGVDGMETKIVAMADMTQRLRDLLTDSNAMKIWGEIEVLIDKQNAYREQQINTMQRVVAENYCGREIIPYIDAEGNWTEVGINPSTVDDVLDFITLQTIFERIVQRGAVSKEQEKNFEAAFGSNSGMKDKLQPAPNAEKDGAKIEDLLKNQTVQVAQGQNTTTEAN